MRFPCNLVQAIHLPLEWGKICLYNLGGCPILLFHLECIMVFVLHGNFIPSDTYASHGSVKWFMVPALKKACVYMGWGYPLLISLQSFSWLSTKVQHCLAIQSYAKFDQSELYPQSNVSPGRPTSRVSLQGSGVFALESADMCEQWPGFSYRKW